MHLTAIYIVLLATVALSSSDHHTGGSCDELPPTCLPPTCENDAECGDTEKCCTTGLNNCGPYCTPAIDVQEVHAGNCPPASFSPSCDTACLNDQDDDTACMDTQKCCDTSCSGGALCVEAVDTQEVHAGSCLIFGPGPVCIPSCTNDTQCSDTQKCCDRCGKQCIEFHAGYCPAEVPQSECEISCGDDGACENTEKCCETTCGGTLCVEAETSGAELFASSIILLVGTVLFVTACNVDIGCKK